MLNVKCKNAKEVQQLYKEADLPLTELLIDDINEVEAELRLLGEPTTFYVMNLKCRICNHTQVAIVPGVCDMDNLECDNCNNMTAQLNEDE